MEHRKIQTVIFIILAIREANHLHVHIGCLLSEILTFCCHYQYAKQGKMQAFTFHSITQCHHFSGPKTSLTTGDIQGKQSDPSSTATNHP